MTTVLDETLRQLGYRTSVKRLQSVDDFFAALSKGAPRVEATLGGWFRLLPLAGGLPHGPPVLPALAFSRYSCSPAIDRKLRETLALQARDPQRANAAWERLERELVDQAVVVPVVNPQGNEFVSKRLGNYQHHPFFQMLISQVWVR